MAEATKSTPIPPPPRRTGNAEADNQALMYWTNDFYRIAIRQGELVQKAEYLAAQEALAGQIDPASATAASAQKTANDAILAASTANERSASNKTILETFGTIQVAGGATSATHTFDTEQPDTDYSVVLTPVSAAGTPGINAFLITGQSYLAESFTITVNAAPGSGNSVSFNWHLRRTTQ